MVLVTVHLRRTFVAHLSLISSDNISVTSLDICILLSVDGRMALLI